MADESSVGTRLLGTKDAQRAVDSFTSALNALTDKIKGLAASSTFSGGSWNSGSNWSGGNNGGGATFGGSPGTAARASSPTWNGGYAGVAVGSGNGRLNGGGATFGGGGGFGSGAYQSTVLGGGGTGGNGGSPTFGGRIATAAGVGAATFSAIAKAGAGMMPNQLIMDTVGAHSATLAGSTNGVAGRSMYVQAAFSNNAIATGYEDAGAQYGTNVYAAGALPYSGNPFAQQRYNQTANNTFGLGYGSPTLGGANAALASQQLLSGSTYWAARQMGYAPILQKGGKIGSLSDFSQSFIQSINGKSSITGSQMAAEIGQGGYINVSLNHFAKMAGWNDTTTQGVQDYMVAYNSAMQHGMDKKTFDSLMAKAGQGDVNAQNQLQAAGVHKSGYQSLKDLNATKMNASADINKDYISSMQAATDVTNKFAQAMEKFLKIPAISALVGGSTGAGGVLGSVLGGVKNIGGGLLAWKGAKAALPWAKNLATKIPGLGEIFGGGAEAAGAGAGTEAAGAGAAAGGGALAGAALPLTAIAAAGYADYKSRGLRQFAAQNNGSAWNMSTAVPQIGWKNLQNTVSGFMSGGFSGAWNGMFGGDAQGNNSSVGSPVSDAAPSGTPGARAGQGGGGGGPSAGMRFPRSGEGVVMAAKSVIGTPYSSTLEEPGRGFGCATLAHWCYKQIGVSIPPDLSNNQFKVGTPIDKNSLAPGDLVFFYYPHGVNTENKVNHVGIALGGNSGQMIAAPHTGAFVGIENIDWSHYMGARRYVGSGGTLGSTSATVAPGANGISSSAGAGGTNGTGTGGEPGSWASSSTSEADVVASALAAGAGGAPGSAGRATTAAAGSTAGGTLGTGGVTAGAPMGVSAAMLAAAPKGSNTAKGKALMAILYQAGFTPGANANMAYAIAMAESGGSFTETHQNQDRHHTVDEGLFQLNNYWHREVDQSKVFDPLYNAQQAFRISHGGRNWKGWSTFTGNMYQQFLGGQNGYKTGAWEIQHDENTTVHRGEMVLDQRSAETVRQALLKANVAGGGSHGGGGTIVFSEGAIKLAYSGPASPKAAKEFGKSVVDAIAADSRIKSMMKGV